VLAALVWPWTGDLVAFMGADAAMAADARAYLGIRLLAAPAVLATLAAFGVLRGLRHMRTPLAIALGLNAMNVVLDAVLIFGLGPVPALGLPGAAWATVASQWFGAAWALLAARAAMGGSASVRPSSVGKLLVVGRDLVARTGLLLLFLLLATRVATRIGPEAGAAQQAVRQAWMLAAFLLDAFAASAQSLIGFHLGAGARDVARRVARVACGWGVAAGGVLGLVLWLSEAGVAWLLVPSGATASFAAVWWVAVVAQPLAALSFVTDGIHWGTGDYRYLRNAMLLATGLGALLLWGIDVRAEDAFVRVWIVTDLWIVVRALFGVLRVWPGIGRAPLRAGSG
jgi:MATE family multidrug resistance protein